MNYDGSSKLISADPDPDRAPSARERVPARPPFFPASGRARRLALRLGQSAAFARLSGAYTKIESTVRYLGIEVDDALAVAEQIEV
jgi:hypothetical protein